MTQRYRTDDSVTQLLDKIDFVILPVLNVDGYSYTWIDPVMIFLVIFPWFLQLIISWEGLIFGILRLFCQCVLTSFRNLIYERWAFFDFSFFLSFFRSFFLSAFSFFFFLLIPLILLLKRNRRYRLWRKNRRPHERYGCHGVDLNRNWGYGWGGRMIRYFVVSITVQGQRNWQNSFAIARFRYIEVLFHIFYYY